MSSTFRSLVIGTFVLTCFIAFAPNAAAQCVQCEPDAGCYSCGPSTRGGCRCQPASCFDCLVTTPCSDRIKCRPSGEREAGIKFDETVITEIGQVHPRFAVALISLNKVGGLKDWTKFSTFPARLEASEVVNWLKPRAEAKDFYLDYTGRRVADAAPITIEFDLERVNDIRVIIKGRITNTISDDPPQTQLELELEKGRVVKWNLY